MQAVPLTNAKKLGILGGTFDPIHFGHLAIAGEARARAGLDAVLFIPTGEPPHKPHWQADAEHRYQMSVLATADNPHFFVSRLEIDRPGPSYTVETLRALRAIFPRGEFTLIVGADMALDFHRWREPEAILAQARVLAAARPGCPLDAADPRLHDITLLPTPGLDISSTDLRARIAAGGEIRYLVPDPVAAYIRKYGLYCEKEPGQAHAR